MNGKVYNNTNARTISDINTVILCALNVIFAFIGLFLNFVVIMSLAHSKLRKKLCYFMIFILACFDLAVVVVFHPLIIFETIYRWLTMDCFYSIEVSFVEHLFVFSLTALLTMTLERYLALAYPYFHESSVTKSRMIAVFMLLQLPFGIPYFAFLTKSQETYLEPCLLAPVAAVFIVIVFLNYKIFSMVETLRQRMNITLGHFNDPAVEESIIVKKPTLSMGKVSTCLLAVVCLSACYFPPIVLFFLRRTTTIVDDKEISTTLRLSGDTLLTINSTLNCLIFFYKNSTLRRRGIKIMKKCFCARLRYHY